MKEVYLDNGATTQVDEKVLAKMLPFFDMKYGNANSIHVFGQEASEALEEARQVIAESIGAKAEEIIFTSGGTESNNLALKGAAFAAGKGKHIITTKIEHDCILESCKWLEEQGFKVSYLNVDKEGFVSAEELEKAIRPETILVSIIQGNNEIGTIQNLEELGKVCKSKGIYFHTDACQSYTKAPLDVNSDNLDLVSLNAHKIHGPKGVGALYIRKGVKLEVWQHGGGHEFGLRSGTENVAGAVGMAEAVKMAERGQMKELRDRLIKGILRIKETRLNGPRGDRRLCNNVNISFNRIEGEALVGYLDQKYISASSGSACSSKSLEPSHVLKAIGLKDEEAHGSLRLTLSRFTTLDEINYVLKELPGVVEKLRQISPFGGKK